MYEEYFHLSDAPFRLNPDPRFFYGSRSHNKAMAYLHYGLKQAEGFIVITGPVGAGKSMLIGHLLDQLNTSNVVAANLLTSNIEPDELLGQILSAFRIEPEGEGRTGQIEAFEDYLFDQLNRGRRVLLIIDEAQNLPFKTLEELRMLSNIDYDGTPLFQVFLVGQPEFRAIMEQPNMEQLRQRVIASYHLENLSEDETRDYILHRLSVAGWREDPAFTKGAFQAIHEETTGLPRRINTLCNRLMLYCSLEKAHEVTAEVVENVCVELREEKLETRKTSNALPPVAKVEDGLTPKDTPAPALAAPTPAASSTTKSAQPPREVNADEKIVSIESARVKAASAQDVTTKEPAVGDKEKTAPEPKIVTTPPAAASMSVLDRLRAKKAAGGDRHEATLNDVASAIAAAAETNSGEPLGGAAHAMLEAGDNTDAPQWRNALVRSIDETREELKRANSNVVNITRAVSAREARGKERRKQIAESLGRAESLLIELREAKN